MYPRQHAQNNWLIMQLAMTRAMTTSMEKKRYRTSDDGATAAAASPGAAAVRPPDGKFPALNWRAEADRDKSRELYSQVFGDTPADADDGDDQDFDALLPMTTDGDMRITSCSSSRPDGCPEWVVSCVLPVTWTSAAAQLVPLGLTKEVCDLASIWIGVCRLCNPDVTQADCDLWVGVHLAAPKKMKAALQNLFRSVLLNDLDVRMHETCECHVQRVQQASQQDQSLVLPDNVMAIPIAALSAQLEKLAIREEERAQKIHDNTVELAKVVSEFIEMKKDHQFMKEQLALIISRLAPSASTGDAVPAFPTNASGRGRGGPAR